MSKLSELEIFVSVVDHEGFSAAARALDVSKSHVSKQISRLEDRLGARLLNRTTRQVTLTDGGRAFYERCSQILEELEEAETAVSQMQSSPRGTLRVTVPMSFGLGYIAPAIGDFMSQYPELDVDMHMTDRKVDLVEEGYDLAIRVGKLSDSSLIVRKIAPATGYVCASPAYLEAHGVPQNPEDLVDHDCLLYTYLRTGSTWRLERADGQVASVEVSGRFRANNGTALVAAACRGLGLVLSPEFICADAIRDGSLQRVLEEWTLSTGAIWALYPHRRHLSAKVRLFVDFLIDQFADQPPWQL